MKIFVLVNNAIIIDGNGNVFKNILKITGKAVPDEGRKWRRSSPSGSSGVQREIIIF
jgi:hypothetical protein